MLFEVELGGVLVDEVGTVVLHGGLGCLFFLLFLFGLVELATALGGGMTNGSDRTREREGWFFSLSGRTERRKMAGWLPGDDILSFSFSFLFLFLPLLGCLVFCLGRWRGYGGVYKHDTHGVVSTAKPQGGGGVSVLVFCHIWSVVFGLGGCCENKMLPCGGGFLG